MVDFFRSATRSAMSYLSGEGDGGGGGSGGNAFVGQTVDLGDNMKLKVKKVIAEGGYGFVFIAQDISTGIEYALKRQIVPSENIKLIKQEVAFLTQLGDHPHIIKFITAACAKETPGSAEFLIVTELVTGGELVDIVNTRRLTPNQVLRVFYETCLAVAHMHSQTPPIIHRDLKVENLLLSSKGSIKMCDFGSATTQRLAPDHSWSATQRGLAEEEIQRNTTPMYRAPEMIDLYSNSPVNEKADIWALGCLLYKLCFQEHPFEDSAKLRILNANYHIPPSDSLYVEFHPIIRGCLVVDPNSRPSVDAIIAQLYQIADRLGENFDRPPKEPLLQQTRLPHSLSRTETETNTTQTDTNSAGAAAALQATSQQAQKLFGFMRGGAENLFKNIKDTSSKVISSVQTPRSKSLDISYITSRLLVMSYPYEEGGPGRSNVLKEVGSYLEGTHPSQYLVFNLSGEQYDTDQLSGQVVDYEWPNRSMPSLESLVELCRQLDSWLKADTDNVLVVHCKDGIHPSCILAAAYLLFLRAVPSPSSALRLFAARRLPEGQGIESNASEKRYLNYMMGLVRPTPIKPHPLSFKLQTLKLTSVPIYNETKNGCRPFVEVFLEGERVYTSCSKDNMDKMKDFTSSEGQVLISLGGVTVQGNLLIIVHHIKAIPSVVKSAGMGMSAVKMFKFQVHTGFISPQMKSLTLERNELDGSAPRKQDKFPSPFKVIIDLVATEGEGAEPSDVAWQNLPHPQAVPITCFSTLEEQGEVTSLFGGRTVDTTHPRNPVQAPPPIPQGYGQLIDDTPTGNLLGVTPPQSAGTNLGEYIEYSSYREGEEPSSSSDSASSSSSSDSEGEGGGEMSYKQQVSSSSRSNNIDDDLEAFFSNPSAGNFEESNLLEFSIEDEAPPPPVVKTAGGTGTTNRSTSQGNFDPWGSGGGTTVTPSNQGEADPFQNWNWSSSSTESSASKPPPTSQTSFDPFASNNTEPDLMNLMGTTPLLPTATVSMTTTSSQSSFTSQSSYSGNSYPNSSGYSGWASFTATNTTSKKEEEKGRGGGGGGGWSGSTTTSSDPFGDIWGQASGKAPSSSSTARPNSGNAPSQQTKPTMTNRPTYQMYGGGGGGGVRGVASSKSGSGLSAPQPRDTHARSPSPNQKFGPVPNRSRNQFDDLLDPNLFTNKKKEDDGPASLKDMRKQKELDKITDPEKAKVAEWAEGKEHNIRALLSSLHTILWEGESRWKPVGMHDLVEASQVSRYFRRACLSVHTDKVDPKYHNLARAIFDELNDAYELFEESGAKSLYQV